MMTRERRDRWCTVEIAGVAAAGKSTLTQGLLNGCADAELAPTLQMRRRDHWSYVVHSLPRMIAMAAGWLHQRRAPTWTQVKLIMYLEEWVRWLDRMAGARIVFIDQGPIYALGRLGHSQPPVPGTEAGGDWWRAMIDEWARALDVVVWLDAPDDVLWQRLNRRGQGHDIKGEAAADGIAYLQRYRESYAAVLASLETRGGPVVLRYDTSERAAGDIAADVLARLTKLIPDCGPARAT